MHATATASGGNTGHPEGVSPNASWSDIGLAKRNARDRLIPNSWKIPTENYAARTNVLDVPLTCGILTDREITITSNYDAVDIVNGIKAGTFSAKEVTVAFCKRAAIAQQLVR
jgi:amidase